MRFKSIVGLIKENILLFGIIFLSLIPLLDFFHPGLPITHDGQDHVARIANFYQSLSEGNIVPRWAENLNWGYGHPILMFLYPLPSYFASIFHFMGFSFIDSVKSVFVFSYILSGVVMYFWVKEFLSKEAGFVAAILYLFAPYRFVEMYVRGDIGEHVAFIFPPLILYFLLKIQKFNSKSLLENNIYPYFLGLSLSVTGLILAHNAITLIFLPVIAGYVIYLFIVSKKYNFVLQSILATTLGFLLSSFFLLPAFFEGKYTLRDIVTSGEYASRFVNFKDLLYGQWSYGITGQFSVQIGLLQILLLILSFFIIMRFVKKGDNIFQSYFLFLVFFILSIFLMLKESNFIWITLTILKKFQFPWRFLFLTVFTSSVLGGFVFSIQQIKRINKYILIIFVALVLLINNSYWHAKDYLYRSDSFFENIYNSTTDTGESSPIWSVRFMEKRPIANIQILSGRSKINQISRNTTEHKYIINSSSQSRIRENTLYFPGWKVYVNGVESPIQFQDPANRGLITFNLEKGQNTIDVKFEDTKLRKISNILSLIMLITLVFTFMLFTFRKNEISK